MIKNNQGVPPPAHLSIIQRLVAVYKLWHECLRHIAKNSRYTLGSKIDSLFLDVAEATFIASYLPREQKIPFIKRAITKLDLLRFFLQIAWELKALDGKKYIVLSEPLNEIGRMLGGWHRQLAQKETPPK